MEARWAEGLTSRAVFRAHLLFLITCLGLALAATGPADGDPHPLPWGTTTASVFRVLSAISGLPLSCTGWYLAPVRSASALSPVSVYITAGHCPTPLLVNTADGLEDTLIIARLHSREAAADLTIAERADRRKQRIFLPLANAAPQTGERALVTGYGDGHLTMLVVTALPACQPPFVCFSSSVHVRGGLSGSPIVSLRSGLVLGILVASPSRMYPTDPYVIIATPASVIRASLEFTLPSLAAAFAPPSVPDGR